MYFNKRRRCTWVIVIFRSSFLSIIRVSFYLFVRRCLVVSVQRSLSASVLCLRQRHYDFHQWNNKWLTWSENIRVRPVRWLKSINILYSSTGARTKPLPQNTWIFRRLFAVGEIHRNRDEYFEYGLRNKQQTIYTYINILVTIYCWS